MGITSDLSNYLRKLPLLLVRILILVVLTGVFFPAVSGRGLSDPFSGLCSSEKRVQEQCLSTFPSKVDWECLPLVKDSSIFTADIGS